MIKMTTCQDYLLLDGFIKGTMKCPIY